jgi:addiction module RelE/StbE family toxin
MTLAYSKNFIKQAKKLQAPTRTKLQERIALFVDNPLNPQLRNHALSGKYKEYRSIDVTGDIRALYITTSSETIFEHIGTHSQLYG